MLSHFIPVSEEVGDQIPSVKGASLVNISLILVLCEDLSFRSAEGGSGFGIPKCAAVTFRTPPIV